jgi:hypothetical protein
VGGGLGLRTIRGGGVAVGGEETPILIIKGRVGDYGMGG